MSVRWRNSPLILMLAPLLLGVVLNRFPDQRFGPRLDVWPDTSSIPAAPNTAEDFSSPASCKGAWIMGGTSQADLFLDRCNSVSSPDQGGVDDMELGLASADSCVNEDSDTPDGTSALYSSIEYFEEGVKKCWIEGPDGTQTEFESNNFSHGCWAKSDYSGGTHVVTIFGLSGLETTLSLLDTVGTTGSYAFMSKFFNQNFFSPSTGGAVYAAEVWRFHAMTRVSTGEIVLYHSDTATSDASLRGCGATGVGACNAGYSDAMSVADGTRFKLGTAGTNEFEGNLFECWYVAEVLTDSDMCSICRCGFEGANSGITDDRKSDCNDCTLPGSAATCGDI